MLLSTNAARENVFLQLAICKARDKQPSLLHLAPTKEYIEGYSSGPLSRCKFHTPDCKAINRQPFPFRALQVCLPEPATVPFVQKFEAKLRQSDVMRLDTSRAEDKSRLLSEV